jgi:4-amino-4-deoxy-L-arabinose transferase-like glycosyltransferase
MKEAKVSLAHGRTKRIVHLALILAFSYLLLFYNLGAYSLKEPDEGRYAEIPREMAILGDYVVPHLNFVRYFEKPPLLYWVTALSYKAFGRSEWSFRFPNALFALLTVLATYFFAARRFTERCAFLSSAMLLSSFIFFAMAHIVTIDMLFSFLLFASLLCFHEFYVSGRKRFLYLFFSALALAVLAKGPAALILLAVTIVLFLLAERRLSFLKEMASARGVLLFAVIAVPWFVLVCLKEKEFFQFFFMDQNVARFLTTKHRRSGPLYYFFPVLFGGLFPWSVFLPRALLRLWDERQTRLLLIWCAVVFIFFSASGSKLVPYILPVFPALAVVLALLFESEWLTQVRLHQEVIVYAAFLAIVAGGALALGSGAIDHYLSGVAGAQDAVRGARGLSLWVFGVSLAALILLGLRRVRAFGPLACVLAAYSFLILLAIMVDASLVDRFNTTKRLALAINNAGYADAAIVDYGSFDETLPFYTGKRIYVADYKGELEMGSIYPEAKAYFLDTDAFARLYRSGRPVFVVFKENRLDRLRGLGLERSGSPLCKEGRCLISNRAF